MASTPAPTTSAITKVTPPTLVRGPRGSRLDAEYVASIGALLSDLGPGEYASTGKTFPDKSKARKHTDRVKASLVEKGFANSTAHLSSRLWPVSEDEDAQWVAAIGVRTPSED